jgi:hypothetical protein
MQQAYQQQKGSKPGTSKGKESSLDVSTVVISDDVRLEIANEICLSLQSALKSNNTAALSDVAAIVNTMKKEQTLTFLKDIADRAKGDAEMVELPSDRDFDITAKSALLLFVLQSRTQSNVNLNALKQLEESASFDELQSFFTNNKVKSMIKVIVKHYSQLVKKRVVKQKEAELLI